ncbi:MAG: NAD-dependent epimerase/dehydratase family protein [Planctomycetes bacterium]|nr:NAD-dependent epimerase/dehydratase family protein [Planctomycetota bacterium]
MKALVTGSSGFLGRQLVAQLRARGDSVRGFSRRATPELDRLGVDCRRGDLRDAEAVADACRGVDVVFHCAAVAGIWGRRDHYDGINVQGTQHLLQACQNLSVAAIVYTSSPSVTFDGTPQRGVDEQVGYASRWLCDYPRSKAQAEQSVLAADRPGGLRTCALRPHLIWGPGDEHLVPRLIDRARRGQLRQVGDGSNRIDITHVENAALAHLLAADQLLSVDPVGGRAYFISQGEPVNCWQWINELLAIHGLPPVRRRISLAWAWRIGAFLEFLHRAIGSDKEPRMTRFLAAQLAMDHYFDIRAAQRDFGYQPRISTAQGMQDLAACLGRRK